MKPIRSMLAFFVLVAGTFPAFCQQDDPALGMGFTPYGAYHGGNLDSINLSNGFLNIHIPVVEYPQRGDLNYGVQIVYNPKGWSVLPNCRNENSCSPLWQWKSPDVGLKFDTTGPDVFGAGDGPIFKGSNTNVFTAKTADGAIHEMGSTPNGAESIDGTGIWFSGALFPNGGPSRDRRGMLANGGNVFEDRNGNLSTAPSTLNGVDTLGRSLPASSSISTTDFSGCTGTLPISAASTFSFPGYGGAPRVFKLCYVVAPLQTNFQTTGFYNDLEFSIAEGHVASITMLQSVVDFNGSSWLTSLAWTFEYSSRAPGDSLSVNYGDLTKITLPTGGTISYAWDNFSSCDPTGNIPFHGG